MAEEKTTGQGMFGDQEVTDVVAGSHPPCFLSRAGLYSARITRSHRSLTMSNEKNLVSRRGFSGQIGNYLK